MKIIGRVCGSSNPRAFQIEVDTEDDISVLKDLFSIKTGIPASYQMLTTIFEGQYVRVIEGWSLSFYGFYENQLLNIHDFRRGEKQQKQHFSCSRKICNVNKITSKDKLLDLEEDMFDNLLSISSASTRAQSAMHTSGEQDEDYTTSLYRLSQKIFIKNIQSRKWKEAKLCLDQHVLAMKRTKHPRPFNLIDDLDAQGWNCLHYATYQQYEEICQKLITEGADVNIPTKDDWTPLQLAVFNNNFKLVKIICDSEELLVDQQTSRGTALHLASARGYIKIVQFLVLDKGSNPDLKDIVERKSSFAVATKQVRFFFRQHRKIKNFDIQTALDHLENRKSFFNDLPIKPPIIRGIVQKQHDWFPCISSERFLEINSNNCALFLYKTEEDAPMKPIKHIHLVDILDVSILQRHWPLKKELIHVQIISLENMVIGFKTMEAAEHWISKLNDAITYANYVDKKLNSFLKEKESIGQMFVGQDKESAMFSTIHMNEKIIMIRDEKDIHCQECNIKPECCQSSQGIPSSERGMNFQEMVVQHVRKSFAVEVHHQLNFSDFEILGTLGKGSFGKVFLVEEKGNQQLYAMKMLKKITLIMKYQLKYAVTECNILKRCKHPFIVPLHYAFQVKMSLDCVYGRYYFKKKTPNHLYMVIDYCGGGVLLSHIQREGRFSEQASKFFICELILAVEYIHSLDVIYRDMKPENILIASDGHIKLTDFGLSKEHTSEQDVSRSFCGSPAYLSPEMLIGKGFTRSSDIYGIGCVLYEMLTGSPPFYHEDIKLLYKSIKMDPLDCPKYLSGSAKSLLNSLLEKNPKDRLGYSSISEVKNHEFFEGIDWHKVYEKKTTPPQFIFANQLQPNTANKEKLQRRYADEDYTKYNQKINRVKQWSFIHKVQA